MKCFDVSLKELYGLRGGKLDCILGDCPMDKCSQNWKRPALIVIPGGDYWMVSKREGEPVASFFLGKGFQTFILKYSCCDDGVHYPEQLLEAAAAVDHVRKNAENYQVNPDEIFVVGFSAGGHLTANLSVDYAAASDFFGKDLDCKPTAVGLCYPVITTKAGYGGSHKNLLQGCTEEEKVQYMKRLELDELVSENTPSAFIWTTAEDALVPSENALRFALALARKGIRYELHVYPQGGHGSSTCSWEICGHEEHLRRSARWMEDCAAFFRLYTTEFF